jgi:CelD/BcsL family acetyltransferase involved in cellulose biosynthesis/thymidylate kinase
VYKTKKMRQQSLFKIDSNSSLIEIVTGEKVQSLLSSIEFLNSWDELYNSCRWATVYQGKEFVSTWYKIYHSQYLPVVVKETKSGKLTGLLTLARSKKGVIVGAGASQAEYQVWLSLDDEGCFIKNSIRAIKQQFHSSDIQLKFIPAETPLSWAVDSKWKERCRLKLYQQPLMIIDESVSEELKKKKKRKKINGLKSLGELKFERITDAQTFNSIFDELAAQYDFRKAAMYNKTPFKKDPLKKEFLLALFEKNILHATVLKLNEEIIASNVASIAKNWIHLQGINTHAPSYARYSPGILHFLFLANSLAEDGIEILDLTPGGNSYKELLATKHLPTYDLSIPGSISFYVKEFREKIFYKLITHKEKILDRLSKIGVNAKDVKTGIRNINFIKERIQKMKEQGLTSFITERLKSITLGPKFRIYKIKPFREQNIIPVSKNHLSDLLNFQSKNSKVTRWQFLADAMQKLEREQDVYSSNSNTALMNCVWIKEKKDDNVNPCLEYESALPKGSLILHDFYCHPNAKENLEVFIASVIRETSTKEYMGIYAIVSKKDKILCKTLEEAGFEEILSKNLKQESKVVAMKQKAKFPFSKIKEAIKPSGLVIGILGRDGCGKSTFVTEIASTLGTRFEGTTTFKKFPMLLYKGEIFKKKEPYDFSKPHYYKERGRIASFIKLNILLLEFLFGYWLKIFPLKAKSQLVLCDRYFIDVLADPLRYRIKDNQFFIKLYHYLLPKPDLWIILDLPSEVLLKRKQELTYEMAEHLRYKYLNLQKLLPNSIVINNEQEIEKTVNNASAFISNYMDQKIAV